MLHSNYTKMHTLFCGPHKMLTNLLESITWVKHTPGHKPAYCWISGPTAYLVQWANESHFWINVYNVLKSPNKQNNFFLFLAFLGIESELMRDLYRAICIWPLLSESSLERWAPKKIASPWCHYIFINVYLHLTDSFIWKHQLFLRTAFIFN